MNTSFPLPHRRFRRHSLLNRLLALTLILLGLAACSNNNKKGSISKQIDEELDTMIVEPDLYGCIPDYTDEDYERIREEQSETIITRNGEPVGRISNQ